MWYNNLGGNKWLRKKSYNSFNFNYETHVKFDDDGYLIFASELRSILWCEDPDNIDKIILERHIPIKEFSELLHKYRSNKKMK